MDIVKSLFSEYGREMKTGNISHKGPLTHWYNPELDVTDKYDNKHILRFQQIIGILQWYVELGQIDIKTEVAFIS